jgi:hypothetical protein
VLASTAVCTLLHSGPAPKEGQVTNMQRCNMHPCNMQRCSMQ